MAKPAGFLRIKNWSDFQHYSDRRPPWIKLHARVLDSGDDFMALGELEQWQLVRLWLVASRAERFTEDDQGKVVPVITDDEGSLRRSTMSLRRIPVPHLVTAGWLIQVLADDVFGLTENNERVLADGASTGASTSASVGASTLANARARGRANTREPEVSEKLENEEEAKNASSSRSLAVIEGGAMTTQTLIGHYIDRHRETTGVPPAERTKGQLARECASLLKQGYEPQLVRAALDLLLEKRLHPGTLSTLIGEAAAGPRRQSRPGRVSPSELMAHAQQLREQEEKMFHDAS